MHSFVPRTNENEMTTATENSAPHNIHASSKSQGSKERTGRARCRMSLGGAGRKGHFLRGTWSKFPKNTLCNRSGGMQTHQKSHQAFQAPTPAIEKPHHTRNMQLCRFLGNLHHANLGHVRCQHANRMQTTCKHACSTLQRS